jgi:hypothetical protein
MPISLNRVVRNRHLLCGRRIVVLPEWHIHNLGRRNNPCFQHPKTAIDITTCAQAYAYGHAVDNDDNACSGNLNNAVYLHLGIYTKNPTKRQCTRPSDGFGCFETPHGLVVHLRLQPDLLRTS